MLSTMRSKRAASRTLRSAGSTRIVGKTKPDIVARK